MEKYSCVALIPARSGSKRIPKKNIKLLNGHPLIGYAIVAALRSGVFDKVVVSTDSEEIAAIARAYGAEVPILRPAELAGSTSSDIEWVLHKLSHLKERGETFDSFSILRPTSPFRTEATIRRAWQTFLQDASAHSLRAVERCGQHPAKMWQVDGSRPRMQPVMKNPDATDVPWHSKQYPALPEVYVQNASLEIAWTKVPFEGLGIAGHEIVPFVTEGYEGFDLNHPEDWVVMEYLLAEGIVTLPDLA